MSDKLDWLNKHLVLLRYISLKECEEKEGFKVRPDLEADFAVSDNVESITWNLAKAGKFKEACDFLPYITHKRAAIWWAYKCLIALDEELAQNPPKDVDIADIGASFEVKVPDWAKVKMPEPVDLSPLQEVMKNSDAQLKAMRAAADPEMQKLCEDAVDFAFAEFKKVNGMDPIELVKRLGDLQQQMPAPIDPNSPALKYRAELRAKLAAVQKETVDTIKSVLPPKVPAHEKKLKDNAMEAVYRWVASPDAVNAQKCMDVGNTCPDKPAGLLSLAAFWAFGNLMPQGDQVVPTPPGLAPNGIVQSLLLAALAKGGFRKPKERYEQYFNIAVDVFTGADTWADALVDKKPLHEREVPEAAASAPTATAPDAAPEAPRTPVYKRWKA